MEPVWRPKSQVVRSRIDPNFVSWLLDTSSLTERLMNYCPGGFSVKVLHQAWELPMMNEAKRLNIPSRTYALVRQVHLLCNDHPVVYARTIIPSQSLRGKQRRLSRLGQKPLGAVLFADKSMQRTEMELAYITPVQAPYREATLYLPEASLPIWGRRSVFYLQHQPLLVSEIFLPTITNCSR